MQDQPTYFLSSEPRNFPIIMLNKILDDLDSRLNDLEFITYKTAKKPDISRAKKMALLFELGVLDFLLQNGMSQKEVAYYLHLIINSSEANVEKDLSTRHQDNCPFKTEETYEFLVSTFSEKRATLLKTRAETALLAITETDGK